MGMLVAELLFRDANDDASLVRAVPRVRRSASETDTERDVALVARLQRGDRSAEETIFLLHYAELVRYARRFASSMDAAEDLAQDALVRFLEQQRETSKSADLVELPRALPAVLRTIVRRQALDRWKHDRRAQRAHDEAWSQGVPLGSATHIALPDVVVEREEVALAIRAAFETLPPRTRLVATMRWSDGLGRQAIAAELDVSVRTVDAQLYQAADHIRRILERFR